MAWSDFISEFFTYASETRPGDPDNFKTWAAVSLVAGALERRVWAKTGQWTTWPNLYVLLVASPGVGKGIIQDEIWDLWTNTVTPGTRQAAFHVASDNASKAAFMDEIQATYRTHLVKGITVSYSAILMAAEEFTAFMPEYDNSFYGVLNKLHGNLPVYIEKRRHANPKELIIKYPQINFIGGIQPSYMADHFPASAWQSGMARRTIMVYSPERPAADLFHISTLQANAKQDLLARLSHFAGLYGECTWAPEAESKLKGWHLNGQAPKPDHSNLQDYNRSRSQHIIKLAMISRVSRLGAPGAIELIDLNRAMRWLFEAEVEMPEIFRAMRGETDNVLIEGMHLSMYQAYTRSGNKALHESFMFDYLRQRVKSDKIKNIIETAERSGVIARVAGTADQYVPRPKHLHGIIQTGG